jgi:hypothetical protein
MASQPEASLRHGKLLYKVLVFPPVLASLLLAFHYVPVVPCAAFDPAVSDVLTAVDVPGVPAVTSVSNFAAIPATVDLTSETGVSSVSGAPAIAAITAVVSIPNATGVLTVAGVPTVADIPIVACVPPVAGVPPDVANISAVDSDPALCPCLAAGLKKTNILH